MCEADNGYAAILRHGWVMLCFKNLTVSQQYMMHLDPDDDDNYEEVKWCEIKVEEYQKLIERMPGRIEAVIKVKGGHTKY